MRRLIFGAMALVTGALAAVGVGLGLRRRRRRDDVLELDPVPPLGGVAGAPDVSSPAMRRTRKPGPSGEASVATAGAAGTTTAATKRRRPRRRKPAAEAAGATAAEGAEANPAVEVGKAPTPTNAGAAAPTKELDAGGAESPGDVTDAGAAPKRRRRRRKPGTGGASEGASSDQPGEPEAS